MAGKSPLFPSSRVPERSNAPLGMGLRAKRRRRGLWLILTGIAKTPGLLGFVDAAARIMDISVRQVDGGDEQLTRESERCRTRPRHQRRRGLVEPAARQRLDALAAELARNSASHRFSAKP